MSKYIALIGRKVGMTAIYHNDILVPVTAIELYDLQICDIKKKTSHGYNAVVFGYDEAKKKKSLKKPQAKFYEKRNLTPMRKMKEFRVEENLIDESVIGKKIELNYDQLIDQIVDITAISLGKGFAGVMKRHGFAGLEASHGVSISHRSHGSTGQRQDPGKVFKGKKMAGHMGARKVSKQNIQILSTSNEHGFIFLKGSVPGFDGGDIIIKSAIKLSVLKYHSIFGL